MCRWVAGEHPAREGGPPFRKPLSSSAAFPGNLLVIFRVSVKNLYQNVHFKHLSKMAFIRV